MINRYGLRAKNCSRFVTKSTQHELLYLFIPKEKFTSNKHVSFDPIHVLVKCVERERLYLMPEECLFIKNKNNQIVQKMRVCSVCPILEGAFGRKISRAVVMVQSEQVLI